MDAAEPLAQASAQSSETSQKSNIMVLEGVTKTYARGGESIQVLNNLNLLAGTNHDTRPVHDTLDYFLGQLAPEGLPNVRTQMARRLCRMKVLDPARLLGHLVLLVDATGLFCWQRRHCSHCLRLLPLCPRNVLVRTLEDGIRCVSCRPIWGQAC